MITHCGVCGTYYMGDQPCWRCALFEKGFPKMQTSFDKALWKEDEAAERLRKQCQPTDSYSHLRMLFPISARLVKPSSTYQLPAGQVLMFARTKMIPSAYPVEALFWSPQGGTQMRWFSGDEIELLPPIPKAVVN